MGRLVCIYYCMSKKRGASGARQRIIETAERLFYAEGIRTVGIDRIIAEANVAKMTLYNHFRSKDELILEVLRYREELVTIQFAEAINRHSKRRDPLRAFFAALKDWFESDGFRGCSFINAAVELAAPGHPASRFAVEHKHRFMEMLRGLIEKSAGKKAAKLAPAISVLVEGAIVTAVMERSSKSADVARDAALRLIAGAGD